MQTTTFLAAQGAIDNEGGHCDKVAKFQEVGADFEVPVELLHFGMEISQAGRGALQSFIGADDADIEIPLKSISQPNVIPIVNVTLGHRAQPSKPQLNYTPQLFKSL